VAAIASAVQGAVGFGAALLAAPALLLIHPAFAPGPILVSNLVLTLLVTRREWSSVDLAGLRFVVGGRVLGTLVAAALLAVLSQMLFDAVFGLLVLAAVALSFARGSFERSARNLTAAGVASGLMGTLSSIGGPPVAIAYQAAPAPVFRATLGANLMVGATLSLAAVWAVGRFGATELVLSALLVPAAVAGFWLSRFGLAWAEPARLRMAVLALSTAAALGVLLRALAAILG